jgi:vacuolar-type H+-ATPase subunit H
MSEQSLQDILSAEKAAGERISQAQAAADEIRKDAGGRATRMEADAVAEIESERRDSLVQLNRHVEEYRKEALEEAQRTVAQWRDRYKQRSGGVIDQICRMITGEQGV